MFKYLVVRIVAEFRRWRVAGQATGKLFSRNEDYRRLRRYNRTQIHPRLSTRRLQSYARHPRSVAMLCEDGNGLRIQVTEF